ncbi:MAG: M28 family peptidase [Acidobacteriota bacterium]
MRSLVILLSLLLWSPCAKAAPAPEFSAPAARELLAGLMGDGAPHPVGTTANRAIRQRIERHLEALGYTPETQREFVCGEFRRNCATVENVLTRLAGGDPASGAVLLVAHYDTVPASPGAGDNMSGVAVALEVARLLRAEGGLTHDVLFLFDDGEEAGLLGATAFVRDHPWAHEVRAVVNLDARGSHGPSLLAATVDGDAPLVSAWARSAAPPAGSSLLPALVALLPNTNDLAVLERLRVPGVLFGFLEGARNYHSASDTLSNLSPASLESQGVNALATVRELAHQPVLGTRAADMVWVALGPFVVRWPASWSFPAMVALALAWLVALLHSFGRGSLRPRQLAFGFAALGLSAAGGGLTALLAHRLLRATMEVPTDLVADPLPGEIGLFAAALCGAVIGIAVLRRPCGRLGQTVATLSVLALGGLLAAWKLPGAAYLFLLPIAASALGAWLGETTFAVLAAVVTAATWAPAFAAFPQLFGLAVTPALGAVLGGLTGIASPWLPAGRRAWIVAALAAGLAATALAVAAHRPVVSAEQPQFLSIDYVTDEASHQATWLATGYPIPKALSSAAGFDAVDRDPIPWSRTEVGPTAPAPWLGIPAPTIRASTSDLGTQRRRCDLEVFPSSPEGTLQVVLAAGERLVSASVNDVEIPPDRLHRYRVYREGFEVITIWGPPATGVRVALIAEGRDPLSAQVVERTPGLPPAGLPLLAARGPRAAPNSLGDSTITRTVVECASTPAHQRSP